MVIDRWAKIFRDKLKKASIHEYMVEKYIDDVYLIIGIPEKGWEWVQRPWK